MGLNPWYTGATDPTWTLTFLSQSDNGATAPVDLTGYTVVLEIAPAASAPTFVTGAGTATVTDAVNGVVRYVVATTDSVYTTTGTYLLQLKATNGAAVRKSDYYTLTVRTGG